MATELAGTENVEISAESLDDLDAVYAALRGVAGVIVLAFPAPLESGTQGSLLEFLTVACSGGAITVFLQIIKNLVESGRPGTCIKIKKGRNRIEITSDNVEKALPILKDFLDGS